MFGWLTRRMVNGALKEYGLDSADLKKLAKTYGPMLKGAAQQSAEGNPSETGQESTSPEPPESTGDAILDQYYRMLSISKDAGSIAKWGGLIQERELFLTRSEQGRQNRKGGRNRQSESLTSNLSFDIQNLAPHADDIAGELTASLANAGILPKEMADTAKGVVAGQIRAHPDLVPKLMETLRGTLNKYAGKQGGNAEEQGSQQQPGSVDLEHPETWANRMGYT